MSELLDDHDAIGLAALVRQGQVHPRELVDEAIARIERVDPHLNAVIHRQFERARHEAGGPLPDGPFRGVPFLLKDFDGAERGEPHHQGMRALRDASDGSPAPTARSPGGSALRADPARSDQRARAGDDGHDRARGVRPDQQPVGPRTVAGRIVGRLGRGGRGGATRRSRTPTTSPGRSASPPRNADWSG